MYKKHKGFTLVEMIIVTVIIGILAGIVITVINIPRVQAKSRDSKRIGDLKRIQTALELYFADNRVYPIAQTAAGAFCKIGHDVSEDGTCDNLTTSLANYMDMIPLDPLDENTVKDSENMKCFFGAQIHAYKYKSDDDGGRYVLGAIMELKEDASSSLCGQITNCTNDEDPVGCGGYYAGEYCYCVQNPM